MSLVPIKIAGGPVVGGGFGTAMEFCEMFHVKGPGWVMCIRRATE